MHRILASIGILLVLSALACGCAQKEDMAQESESSVDSLLAANPTEQTPGDLTPQTEYQPPQQEEPAPAPATTAPRKARRPAPTTEAPKSSGVTMPAGTPLKVAVSAKVSSETAQPGDSWTGVIQEPVIVGSEVVIPAGSTVNGVVAGVAPAEKGSRAFLVLAVRSVEANGKTHTVTAGTDSIVAGSTRARNLGAIAGGAAAGALLGKALGGSNKGALIGGLVGGAAATGAVSASKGYQVEVKEGTELTFHVNDSVVMR